MNIRDDHIPMDSPQRCERTELIKTQCGHCRPPRQPQFVEVPSPPFLGYDTPDDSIVATFVARFGGRCGRCDEVYGGGDHIGRTGTGDYLCSSCAEP